MNKFVMSFCAVFVLAAFLLVTGCKAPSSGGGSGEIGQGGGQSLQGGQQNGAITKDNVADYIKSMTQSGTVKVTREITEQTVIDIGDALRELYTQNDSIKINLDMTETTGITQLSDYSFSSCDNLSGIVIPDSVKTIEEGVFRGCKNLENVTIGKNVELIGENAFNKCYKLKTIIIPDSVKTISNGAFCRCKNLENVTIGKDVESIGSQAFALCNNLKSINYTGTEEQWNAIQKDTGWDDGCPADMKVYFNAVTKDNIADHIKNMTQSGTITFTGEFDENTKAEIYSALDTLYKKNPSVKVDIDFSQIKDPDYWCDFLLYPDCKNLVSVTIPDSLGEGQILTDGSYYGSVCSSLCQINVTDNNERLSSIDGVLYNMIGLEIEIYPPGKTDSSYSVPDNFWGIDPNAFAGAKNLETIIIPLELEYIGSHAFAFCPKLKTIKYEGTQEQWNAIQNTGWDDGCPADVQLIFNYVGN